MWKPWCWTPARITPIPTVAAEAHGVRFVSLLKISTDEGITGWSDIETQPHVGKAIVDAPSGGQIGFESLRAALIGEDPLEHERLWQKMVRYLGYYGRQGAGMQMISGADIALWDIAGKACGQPVCKLLGAQYRERVKAYASTLFRPTPDDMKRAVEGYLEQGFEAIKFGWGAFGHDLEAGHRIGRSGPRGGRTGHRSDGRRRMVRHWLRRSLPAASGEGLDSIWSMNWKPLTFSGWRTFCIPKTLPATAKSPKPRGHCASPPVSNWPATADFERLAEEGRVHTLQPDLSRCGGLTVGRQIADMAQRRGIDCVPHAWLTDLLKAASLHLNAYLMDSLYLEYNVSSASLLNTLCREPIRMVDGYIPVPHGPGLGVDVDTAVVAKFRVA